MRKNCLLTEEISGALLIKNLIVALNGPNHFYLTSICDLASVVGEIESESLQQPGARGAERGRAAKMSTEIALPGFSSRDVIELPVVSVLAITLQRKKDLIKKIEKERDDKQTSHFLSNGNIRSYAITTIPTTVVTVCSHIIFRRLPPPTPDGARRRHGTQGPLCVRPLDRYPPVPEKGPGDQMPLPAVK
ncbi:hypothetical protein CEXT_750511 [Caerostris extrusa]|uniref:Uncharacterized protein n=1 Tax=Caerostris extrusa TaxID=172846 RepID=A0AAV4TMX8_CAEEX|nr:hypothetical protein CEXT_750511 [Caerostris extrusa]